MAESSSVKKRRSSFVAGRLSRKEGDHGNTIDLYMNVPTTLPPEERLLRILKLCYERAVETVGQEFLPSTGIALPEFIVHASESFDDVRNKLEEKKLCKLATENSTSIKVEPTLLDLEIKSYEEYAKRLSKETAEWNKIETEENENLISESSSVLPATTVLPMQETGEEASYNNLITELLKGKEVVGKMLNRVQEVNSLFHGIEHLAEDFFEVQRDILCAIPFSTIDDTPHRLVKSAARIQ